MKSKLVKCNDGNNRQSRIGNLGNLGNLSTSGNNELNCLSQLNDLKELRNQNINDNSTRLNSNIFKREREGDNNFESLFLKNLVENLFEYLSEQNNKEQRLFSKMDEIPMLGEIESNRNLNNNSNYYKNLDSLIKAQLNNNNNASNNFNNLNSNLNANNINNLKEDGLNFESFLRTNANSINNKYGEKLKKIGQANTDMENIQLLLKENLTDNFNQNSNRELKRNMDQNINQNFNTNLLRKNTSMNTNMTMTINPNEQININNVNNINNINNPLNPLSINEEEKSLFMKDFFSPNPFDELQTNNAASFLNSPKINPYGNNLLKSIEENNDKLNINFDLSRNSSLDYSGIFRNTSENKENKKQARDDNLLYDDSFFEISSN